MRQGAGSRATNLSALVFALVVVGAVALVGAYSALYPSASSTIGTSTQAQSSCSATTGFNGNVKVACGSTTSTNSGSLATTTPICYFSGEPWGVALQVLSDGGSPVPGVEITGRTVGNQCGDYSISSSATNSTGWVTLPGNPGAYNLTVSYSGREYNVGAPMFPISLTTIKIHVPTGLWTIEARYGTVHGFPFVGPSYVSKSPGSLQLNVTLSASTARQGSDLPVKLSFIGPGASDASHANVTLTVTNSQGVVVGNSYQRVEDLYFLPGAASLRGFTSFDDWNVRSFPPEFNVPVTPGMYTITISAEVDGRLLMAGGPFQVTP
jgi:hypothetical protein